MKLNQLGWAVLAVCMLAACSKKEQPAQQPGDAPAPAPNAAAALPDVGKVDTVVTRAEGFGPTAAVATSEAMKLAILQVNGASIASGAVNARFGLDVTDGKDALALRASSFADVVAQRSGGAITQFKVLEISEPLLKGGQYKVGIEAAVAHFTAPVDKKLKVVVAPLRADTGSFMVGLETVSSATISREIQDKVAVALTNTGRFTVLDRQDDDQIEQELELITSGKAPRAETGKLGQVKTADVIWTGKIEAFAYNRHARQLRTSDRELVSYSGGWGVSQKLVNVATRQVLSADTLRGRAPDVAATTMGASVNAAVVSQNMQNEIANAVVSAIISRTFPVTVVSREENNVILSQGGQSVQAGSRYAMVVMGKELKDPQTGESLGRTESPCCELVVDKVSANLSYGHLENVGVALDKVPEAGLQLREKLKSSMQVAKAATSTGSEHSSAAPGRISRRSAQGQKSEDSGSDIQSSKEDGKW